MKKNNRSTLWSAAAVSLLAGFAAAPVAVAQEAQTAEADEEIVVTARRREEALQDVPISVTALTQEALQDRQISSTADLAAFTPGFQFNEAFGRDGDRPVIRGASNILISEGKVGVFLDGAPIVGDSSGIDLRSFARIEVIRGPQAAVFGRGTESGAINYVSRRPGAEWEYQLEASSGTWERSEAYLSAMGPILPNLGASIAFRAYEFGGDYANTLGGRLGAQSTDTWNAALFFEPMRDLSFDVRYINSEDSDGHFAVQLIPASANNCFLTTRPYNCGTLSVPDTFTINTSDILQPGLQRETERYFFNGSWDIAGSGYTLSYQYASADQHEVTGYDQSYDGRTFFIFGFCPGFIQNRLCSRSPFNDTSGAFQESATHEIRLESPSDQRLRWRLGYFDLDIERTPDLAWLEVTQSGGDSPGSVQMTRSQAWFGGIDFDVTDRLTIGAEVRGQNDEIIDQGLSYRFGDVFPVPPPGLLGSNPNQIIGNTVRRQAEFESTLPRVTATYAMSDAINLYGQYAVGNAPGGFNPTDAPSTTFDEETLTNYEIGLKTQLFGFDYLNLALFRSQIEDQVLTSTYLSGTTQTSYRANIGEVEINGLEIELQRQLFEGLTFAMTYSYLDAEYVSGFDAQQALFVGGSYCTTSNQPDLTLTTPGVTVGGVPTNTSCLALASVVGHSPPLVSPHQASFSLNYERPIGGGFNLFAGADLTYRDSFYSQVDNLNETGDAKRVNAQFGIENEHIRLSIWGRNIFDEDTPEGILRYVDFPAPRPPTPPGVNTTQRAFAISAPRREVYGITLGLRF